MMKLIILILLLCSCAAVHSQSKVNALVQDDKGFPIPFAAVYNSSSGRSAITNEEAKK